MDITNCLLAFLGKFLHFLSVFFCSIHLTFFASTIVVCSILFFSIIQDYDDCCCFLFWVCCFLCFFQRIFLFTLLFIFWRSFWRSCSRRKKRVGIIMSDRKIVVVFLGYQKVFDPKNNSFLLFFCLSWHSRMTMISIRLSSAASSSSLIMLGFFIVFITRNHKSILCNVWLWANSDHFCCFLFKCCCCFFYLSFFFLLSFIIHHPTFCPKTGSVNKTKNIYISSSI